MNAPKAKPWCACWCPLGCHERHVHSWHWRYQVCETTCNTLAFDICENVYGHLVNTNTCANVGIENTHRVRCCWLWIGLMKLARLKLQIVGQPTTQIPRFAKKVLAYFLGITIRKRNQSTMLNIITCWIIGFQIKTNRKWNEIMCVKKHHVAFCS